MNHFRLILRSEGRHVAPVEIRIRQVLKIALRGFGLRCVEIDTCDASDICQRSAAGMTADPSAAIKRPRSDGIASSGQSAAEGER